MRRGDELARRRQELPLASGWSWVVSTLIALLAFVGCGNVTDGRPPSGPLAEALADISGGTDNGSLGVGWVEPRRLDRSNHGAELITDALGPNAGTVIEAAAQLRRRFGIDPLSAERLVSVGGSYAFGLRLDGVDGPRLPRALTRSGGRTRRTGALELVDVGGYAVVPKPLLRAGVLGLGARDAFAPTLTVLAISDMARDALLGRGKRMLERPIYRAAAACLGDVIAARMVPDALLPIAVRGSRPAPSTELGVDLVAMGVKPDEREVLCVLGGSSERSSQIASALERSLAPDARDPLSGESMGKAVRAVDVVTESHDSVEAVRAGVTPTAGQAPGFLFGALARGSLPELINPLE